MHTDAGSSKLWLAYTGAAELWRVYSNTRAAKFRLADANATETDAASETSATILRCMNTGATELRLVYTDTSTAKLRLVNTDTSASKLWLLYA